MSPSPEKNDNTEKNKLWEEAKDKNANGVKANESQIKKLYLHENVAGGRGRHTTVSVLEPTMWIERTKEDDYRIVCRFDLQFKIHAFEKGFVTIR